jgi:hypothetical protein
VFLLIEDMEAISRTLDHIESGRGWIRGGGH